MSNQYALHHAWSLRALLLSPSSCCREASAYVPTAVLDPPHGNRTTDRCLYTTMNTEYCSCVSVTAAVASGGCLPAAS